MRELSWMLDHVRGHNTPWTGGRQVYFEVSDGVLSVSHTGDDGDTERKYYKLVEVEQRWVEIDG